MACSNFELLFQMAAKEVQEISLPLKKYFNTTYLNFVRRFEDGTESCLTTDPAWTKHFYEKKLYKQVKIDRVFIENEYLANKTKIIPWTQFLDSPVRLAQSQFSGVGVGLSILFVREGYADFFHFGTRVDTHFMNHLYSNYSDCLLQFTHYFYDTADELIRIACEKQNKITPIDRIGYKQAITNLNPENLDIAEFVKATKPKRFLVHGSHKTVHLSYKEVACIRLASMGMSAPRIGEKLYISNRTVETHIKNVRDKLGLSTGATKAEVIQELISHGFDIHRILPSDRLN